MSQQVGMIKITQCSKAIGTNHVPKFCSPSPFTMTSSNEQNIILQVKKQQTNKQWETKRKNKHSLAQFNILPALINSKLNHFKQILIFSFHATLEIQRKYKCILIYRLHQMQKQFPPLLSAGKCTYYFHTRPTLNESNQQNKKKVGPDDINAIQIQTKHRIGLQIHASSKSQTPDAVGFFFLDVAKVIT